MVTLNLLIQYCRVSCTKLYYYHRPIKMQNILLFSNALNELCFGTYAKCEYNPFCKALRTIRISHILVAFSNTNIRISESTCCPCNASYLWCNFRTSFHLYRFFLSNDSCINIHTFTNSVWTSLPTRLLVQSFIHIDAMLQTQNAKLFFVIRNRKDGERNAGACMWIFVCTANCIVCLHLHGVCGSIWNFACIFSVAKMNNIMNGQNCIRYELFQIGNCCCCCCYCWDALFQIVCPNGQCWILNAYASCYITCHSDYYYFDLCACFSCCCCFFFSLSKTFNRQLYNSLKCKTPNLLQCIATFAAFIFISNAPWILCDAPMEKAGKGPIIISLEYQNIQNIGTLLTKLIRTYVQLILFVRVANLLHIARECCYPNDFIVSMVLAMCYAQVTATSQQQQ